MNENSTKEVRVIDNTHWKERHQFVLSANGNIICQRYFKVNGFNPKALESLELTYTVRDIVDMIKADLVSKSRVYTGITMNKRTKLTGFYKFNDELSFSDVFDICSDSVEGEVTLSNGVTLNKTFIDQEIVEETDDEPFEFKFSYLFDDKLVCEEIWDGSVYPKYIRNSVDLSNSNSSYKYTDPMRMTFSQQMTKHLNEGRKDLIYAIIRMFCDTLSNDLDEEGNSLGKDYTEDMEYGDTVYLCTSYPREYVKGWANVTRQKTIKYKRWMENDIPQSVLDYVDKNY